MRSCYITEMFIILEQYFKDYPIKMKVVKGLFDNGISVREGKLYINNIEIPITEVAKALSVNRRTVYDTIKMIMEKDPLRAVMENIRSTIDRTAATSLMGYETVVIVPKRGCFQNSLKILLEKVSGYLGNVSEISAVNESREENYIRVTFNIPIPERVFVELEKCSCISRLLINTPKFDSESYVCPKCEVTICPKKLMTSII